MLGSATSGFPPGRIPAARTEDRPDRHFPDPAHHPTDRFGPGTLYSRRCARPIVPRFPTRSLRAFSRSSRWYPTCHPGLSTCPPAMWIARSRALCAGSAGSWASIFRCSGNCRVRSRASSPPHISIIPTRAGSFPSRCARSSSPGTSRRCWQAALSPTHRWKPFPRRHPSTERAPADSVSGRISACPFRWAAMRPWGRWLSTACGRSAIGPTHW